MRISGLSLHSLFVHFPVALLPVSLLWDVLGLWTGDALWWTMSFWTLVVGLLAAVPTTGTGFVAYARLSPGSPAELTATRHLLFTAAALTAFLASLLVRGSPEELKGASRVVALICSGGGAALLAAGGHLGAVLVYRHGVGVSEQTEGPRGHSRM